MKTKGSSGPIFRTKSKLQPCLLSTSYSGENIARELVNSLQIGCWNCQYSRVSNIPVCTFMYFYKFSTIYGQIKRSHSIYMLSIQIDTKSLLKLVIHHQFNSFKWTLFASLMKWSFPLCTFSRRCRVIKYSRVLFLKYCQIWMTISCQSIYEFLLDLLVLLVEKVLFATIVCNLLSKWY